MQKGAASAAPFFAVRLVYTKCICYRGFAEVGLFPAKLSAGVKTADFEWDEAKRRGNLEKHGFDFADAGQVFDGVHSVRPSRFPDEERYIALGRIAGRGVAVIFTRREARFRIICIRRARTDEEKDIEILERQSPAVDD